MIEIVSIKADTAAKNSEKKPEEIGLLPCPFCGAAPDMYAFYDREMKRMRWHAMCSNTECPVLPFGRYEDTMEESVTAWNARA